jgi:unsaturated rhamnogalacturonyl hydrolase
VRSLAWIAATLGLLAVACGSAGGKPGDSSGAGGATRGDGGGAGTTTRNDGGTDADADADGNARSDADGNARSDADGNADNTHADAHADGNADTQADAALDADAAPVAAVDRVATLEIMRRVASYELTRFGVSTNANWVRAVFYAGLLALYRASNDAPYLTATRSWGQATAWRLGTDSASSPRWADNQACVQTYADLYLMDPSAANAVMVASGRAAFDQMVAAPMAGRVEWWWEDALFMAPPALARIAQATPAKAEQYRSLLHGMWWDTKAFLYNDTQQLFWRDSTFLNTNTYWSRGNGWVVAGIARLLDALPADDARRADYEDLLRQMAARLRTLQAADGFWRSDLLNPDAFPTPESSGTAFFCFGLAWGINHGILDRATYLDTVLRAWTALGTAVSSAGRLGWVQAVGARPGPSSVNDTNDYATGAFLLAGAELLRL